MEMINQGHFQRTGIKDRLDELHELWELLLKKLSEKGLKLQQVYKFSISRKNKLFHIHILIYFFFVKWKKVFFREIKITYVVFPSN